MEEELDAPPSSPSEASKVQAGSSGDESAASAEREAALLELGGWERNPREEGLRSESRHPLSEELRREWEEVSKHSAAWLDGFVRQVTDAFLNADPGVADRRRVQDVQGQAGRAGAKRRRYADTQELFKRCPARLADLVRRNDLRSLLDPGYIVRPPADRIKDAYGRLWGDTGRCDLQLQDVAPANGLCPVTATEVRRRIKKLQPNGAPGLDGIRKKHLLALEGGPGLLAGLFNCLLWTRKRGKRM